jgi:hypothetical protein
LWAICLGWTWTTILPISASQVARITGVNYWGLEPNLFFLKTESCYVAQTGLEFKVLLPQSPRCWDYWWATTPGSLHFFLIQKSRDWAWMWVYLVKYVKSPDL